MTGLDFNPTVQYPGRPQRLIASHSFEVLGTQMVRHDQGLHWLALRVVSGIAKQAFSRPVEFDHPASTIDGDDRIERALKDREFARLAGLGGCVG